MLNNTNITEHQRLKGVINGTDKRYIKKEYLETWKNIVHQHQRGQTLSPKQATFLEMVKTQSSRYRHYQHQRQNFNHSEHRLPKTFRG